MPNTPKEPVVKTTKVTETKPTVTTPTTVVKPVETVVKPEVVTKTVETPLVEVPEVRKDELTILREFALTSGVNYSAKDTVDTLKEKIEAKLNPSKPDVPEEVSVDTPIAETKNEIRARIQKEALKLVRVSIICNNPNKREYEGEIFTVQNKYIGVVRKMVPFGVKSEKGFHVPQVLLNVIKERKFQQITTRKEGTQTIVDTALVPEFGITVLPPLNEEEIKELADQQAAAARIVGS